MKKIPTTIKSLIIAGMLVAGTAVVLAWSAPTTTPLGGKTFASFNSSGFHQAKSALLGSEKFLMAGNNIQGNPETEGFVVAKTLIGSSRLMATNHVLVSGTDSQVKIGGDSSDLSTPLFTNTRPLTIDTTGRGAGASASRAIDVISDNSCNNVNVLTNTKGLQYYSSANNTNADLIGRQVRLSGGNPQPGKILISVNENGDAVWATPRLQGNQIIFDTTTSPVTNDLLCGNPAPVPGCTDPNASNYDRLATQDNGSCTYTCPTGQYWDSTARSCLCDDGSIRAGQVPLTTNMSTTGKIVDYINGQPGALSGGSYPLVPSYVMLDELRKNGGPGTDCRIVAFDAACPAFDLATVNNQSSFTIGGTTYQTRGGNSWEVDADVGDQCIKKTGTIPNEQVTTYNIERP